jgi:hypothetical protein
VRPSRHQGWWIPPFWWPARSGTPNVVPCLRAYHIRIVGPGGRPALRGRAGCIVAMHPSSWDLVADLCWMPLIWFVVMGWEWVSLQACHVLVRFASEERRREWGYE